MKKTLLIPVLAFGSLAMMTGCKSTETTLNESKLNFTEVEDQVVINGTKLSDNDKSKITSIVVPSSINGKKVLQINKGAFKGFSNLKSISLPFIGKSDSEDLIIKDVDKTFGYIFGSESYEGGYRTTQFSPGDSGWNSCDYYIPQKLTSVTITDTDVIPAGAFSGCYFLNDISFGDKCSCLYTGRASFYECENLKSVKLPNSVTEIESYSFAYCYSLPTISLPTQLTSINYRAFNYCTSLDYIVIPSKVTYIGEGAFFDCNNYDISLGANYVNDYPTIIFESANVEWLNYAYQFARPEVEIEWEDDGDGSSSNKPIYPVVVGYKGISGITEDGFKYAICRENSQDFAVICNYAPKSENYINSVTIPESINAGGEQYLVREIAPSAFQGIKNVDQLDIPSSVVYIGSFAFRDGDIGSLTFSGEQTSSYGLNIGTGAFSRLNIGSISGIKGLKTIPAGMFARSNVLNYEVSASVKSIGYEAFYYSNLEQISFAKDESGNSALEEIGYEAFEGCNLKTITIPKSVKYIGYGAFEYCQNLESVQFEEGSQLRYISEGAFYHCTALKTVDLSNCSELEIIDDYAFCYCTDLKSCDLSKCNKLQTIGDNAFEFDKSLRDITIPNSVETIGYCAFGKCTTLNNVTFVDGGSALYIGRAAFAYTAIKAMNFPSQLVSLYNNAFRFCSYLETVTFPTNSSLSYVGNLVFAGCTKLTSIEFPASMGVEGSYMGTGIFDYRYDSYTSTFYPINIVMPFSNYMDMVKFVVKEWDWEIIPADEEYKTFAIMYDGYEYDSEGWTSSSYYLSEYHERYNYSCFADSYFEYYYNDSIDQYAEHNMEVFENAGYSKTGSYPITISIKG